nr:unnamed protein product [Haemonchus contortus]
MGGWFSSFLTLRTFIYPSKQLAIHSIANQNPDPFVILSAAAEIAALHRRMEDTLTDCPIAGGQMLQEEAGHSSVNYDDTDLEDSVSSLLRNEKDETSSSDEDALSETACPRTTQRRRQEMFEMHLKMSENSKNGRMYIGNPEVCIAVFL